MQVSGPETLKILLADRHQLCSKSHTRILSRSGFDVTQLNEGGSKVVNFVKDSLLASHANQKKTSLDVILLTLLDGDDGDEVRQTVQQVRLLNFKGVVLVFVLSEYSDYGNEIPAGVDDIGLLPITADKIITAVRAVFARRANGAIVGQAARPPPIRISSAPTEIRTETDDMIPSWRYRKNLFGDRMHIKVCRILIVFECAHSHEELSEELQAIGHSVVQADSGIVAVSMIRNSIVAALYGAKDFDLVIVDNKCSDMCGHVLVGRLRDEGYQQMIIGSVACADSHRFEVDPQPLVDAGADVVLTHPFTMKEVNMAIKEACGFDDSKEGGESSTKSLASSKMLLGNHGGAEFSLKGDGLRSRALSVRKSMSHNTLSQLSSPVSAEGGGGDEDARSKRNVDVRRSRSHNSLAQLCSDSLSELVSSDGPRGRGDLSDNSGKENVLLSLSARDGERSCGADEGAGAPSITTRNSFSRSSPSSASNRSSPRSHSVGRQRHSPRSPMPFLKPLVSNVPVVFPPYERGLSTRPLTAQKPLTKYST